MTPDIFATAGVRLGLIIVAGLLVVFGVAAAVLFIAKARTKARVKADGGSWEYDDRIFGLTVAAVITACGAGLAAIILAISAFPYQPRYLLLYRTTATVESVSNVLEQADGDLTRTPVVELAGLDRPAVVDDPRIVRLEGQEVTFTCRISWHYQAADTYSCAIYEIGDAP